MKRKLFDKKNGWWYDSAYQFARHSKWFDNDKFGFAYKGLKSSYSLKDNASIVEHNGIQLNDADLLKLFHSRNSF